MFLSKPDGFLMSCHVSKQLIYFKFVTEANIKSYPLPISFHYNVYTFVESFPLTRKHQYNKNYIWLASPYTTALQIYW